MCGVERRAFLGYAVGGAATAWVSGCGDDGTAGTAEGGTSSSGADGTVAADGASTGITDETGLDDTVDSSGDSSGTETGGPAIPCDEPNAFEEEWEAGALEQDDETFPLAVMAGEMRPNSAMFTVLIDDAQTKFLRVWRAGSEEGVVLVVAEVEVTPSETGYAKVMVDGLCPGNWYSYAWLIGQPGDFTARSAIGQVRTAIATDALEPLTIAMAACNGSSLEWPAVQAMTDTQYDMMIHLGDMAYNDGNTSLDEYRASWRQYMGAPDMRASYAQSGLYATWDDHEIDDNSNFDRETMDPGQLLKRQNALDAYFELLPIDATGPDYTLWRSFRWGLTAEIFVLDCRYERRPSVGQYISQAQMDWLKQALSDSPCQFKVVMNSVPITNMPGLVWDFAANDRWEGFPDSRAELLGHIRDEAIENVWFLTGDLHVCFVSTLENGTDMAGADLREIGVTSGNVNPLGDILPAPQFDYGSSDPHGCLLHFDPKTNSVNVRFIAPDGSDDYNEDLSYDE